MCVWLVITRLVRVIYLADREMDCMHEAYNDGKRGEGWTLYARQQKKGVTPAPARVSGASLYQIPVQGGDDGGRDNLYEGS